MCPPLSLRQIVIPNKMGMVLYHPASASDGLITRSRSLAQAHLSHVSVSPQSERLCRLLAQRYRVNLFDQTISNVCACFTLLTKVLG